MNERLLQYLWQFQHYNRSELFTEDGETLTIIHPGTYNTSQGPDFLNGMIRCGDTQLAGSIELHVKSTDWNLHGHAADSNYNNCILHVVWEHDKDIDLPFPVLELQHRVPKVLLEKYEGMMLQQQFIPCAAQFNAVDATKFSMWKERLLIERLQERTAVVRNVLEETKMHWDETFHRLLLRNFGMKVNGVAFEELGRLLPASLLARHATSILQLEALLFGASGLLKDDEEDKYATMLGKEYLFLQRKYDLKPSSISFHFLRMRPANFPTVRVAQFAALVQQGGNLFSAIKDKRTEEIVRLFDVTANDYWHYHYRFGQESAYTPKHLGAQMINNILINTVGPVLYAYGWYNNIERYKDRAIDLLASLPAESNTIIAGYKALGAEIRSAADSQALIQLKNCYCNKRRCLECVVGVEIIRG